MKHRKIRYDRPEVTISPSTLTFSPQVVSEFRKSLFSGTYSIIQQAFYFLTSFYKCVTFSFIDYTYLGSALGGISIGVFAETMERVGYSVTNKTPVPFSTILLQFGIYFVCFDLYYYLLHRFFLHGRYGWWIHKEHHSSFICNPTTGFSFHAIEAIITGGFNPFLGWLLQFHPTTIILVQLYGLTDTVIHHSGYEYYPIEWNKKWYTK
jgi:sterol desaturase/sphingolipid hydroxylase (fatty acid hydroxylase superfamily)